MSIRARTQRSDPRTLRRALAGSLLGAVVIAGPWTVPAAASSEPAAPSPADTHDTYGPVAFGAAYGPPARTSRAAPRSAAPREDPPVIGDVATVFARASAATGAQAEIWTMPVTGFPISAHWGIPGGWAAGRHTGTDFAVPVGTPVQAAGPGTVIFAGDWGDYGKAVLIEMTDGYYTLYAHLSEIHVKDGQVVNGGERAGLSGNTGRSTGPHLHFEVRTSRAYGSDVDPLAYLASHGVATG
ncbi:MULTISPECIES: M23 family metallopeptidase [Streptomyces]|uniref:M23ase beta-sheet core domain-containing protein n=1 Tax=Streptomyces cheonanensis TaxID=312720 RepID=A0ABP5G7Z0_9ACTN|nr:MULTISPECIES: M23 family metallopeptidase [Streptomyces]